MVSVRSLAKAVPEAPPAAPEGSPCATDSAICAVAAALAEADTVADGLPAALATLAQGPGPALALHLRTGGDKGFRCAAAVGPVWDRIPRPQYRALLDRCLAQAAPLQEDAERFGLPHGGMLHGMALRYNGHDLAVLLAVFDGAPTDQDRRGLQALALLLSYALAASDLRAALARREGLDHELELAAEIQRGLLPGSDLGRCPVIGLNRPIRRVSGDFYDFFWLDESRVAFALGDVSGKGINAALMMAKTAGLFRCLAKSIADPAEVLCRINRELCETASRGMFVTMVAGVYNQGTGQVICANAGHEPPLLRSPERCYSAFPAECPPLGIAPEFSPASQTIALGGGELYLFSDGLTEFRYGTQEALRVKGLVQMIEGFAELPLDARLHALLSELDHEGWEARDDLTVLAIDDAWVRR